MQSLESLDRGQGGPVHRVDMPYADWPENSTKTVTEKSDGYRTENHSGSARVDVVEESLGSEDLRAGCGLRS